VLQVVLLGIILHAQVLAVAPRTPEPCFKPTPSEEHTTRHLEKLTEAKLRKLIRTRDGNALFINVWATWCQPCVEEFPDIVRLSEDMKGQKIEFVGVSGDDMEDESSKVIPFIEKEKAHFKFYIAKLEGEDEFINAFDKQWGGGIPATFTFDAHGRLKAFLLGEQRYEHLKAAAEKALGAKKTTSVPPEPKK